MNRKEFLGTILGGVIGSFSFKKTERNSEIVYGTNGEAKIGWINDKGNKQFTFGKPGEIFVREKIKNGVWSDWKRSI